MNISATVYKAVDAVDEYFFEITFPDQPRSNRIVFSIEDDVGKEEMPRLLERVKEEARRRGIRFVIGLDT